MKRLAVWHWNVAGHKIHAGATTTGLVAVATGSIDARKADFVSLNELCFGQYQAIQDRLRALGWPADPDNFSRFAETRPAGASTCGGQAFGNAIFSKAPLGAAERVTLPSDGSAEARNMLCAPLVDLPHLRFCTTHITTSNELAADGVAENTRQLVAVLARLEAAHAAGDTVVIAGDFNAQPDYARMNRFYSSKLVSKNNADNTGHYRELDDTEPRCPGYGEGTDSSEPMGGPCGTGKKIDLVFVREDRTFGPYESDALAISNACGGPCSYHNIVIGWVDVIVEGLRER
jgi:endonuclease/exonuclease/phosphatase family metal-dependent hydrolase